MQNSNIPNVAPKPSPDQIYGDAGLLYIRYHVQIETKPNGQKNMGGALDRRSAISPNISTTHLDPATTTLSSWVVSSSRVVGGFCCTATTRRTRPPIADSISSRN